MDSTTESDAAPFRHWPLVIKAVVILIAGVVVLQPTLFAPWYGDDDLYITGNPLLRDPNHLWEAWFAPGSFIEYYPITESVQWFQWKLWGTSSPVGYHLTNLALHLLSALLIWRLFTKLGLRYAWIGGLIFAIHPMMVDTIAAANELKNTLSLPPFLIAMGFWLDFENTRKSRSYCLALVWFLVAVLCKITPFFFPLVIFVYAWWKRDRINRTDILHAVPFFVISLVLGWLTIHAGEVFAQRIHYQSPGPIHLGGFVNRIALAGFALAFYLGRAFFPLHLLPYYPLWPVELFVPWMLVPWLCVAVIFGCCWIRRNSWGRHALLGLAFFYLGLAPFLGFKEASYMCLTWFLDHFAYIPIIGLIGLVVAGAEYVGRLLTKPALLIGTAAFAGLLILLASQAYGYSVIFSDPATLWADTVKYNPRLWLARYEIAMVDVRKNDLPAAVQQLQESVHINPDFFNAQVYLGVYLSYLGRNEEAAKALAQAVRIAPWLPVGHTHYGHVLVLLGRNEEAIQQLNLALASEPYSTDILYGLSYALAGQGRIPEAIEQIQKAMRINPDDPKIGARLEELQKYQQQHAHPPAATPSKKK